MRHQSILILEQQFYFYIFFVSLTILRIDNNYSKMNFKYVKFMLFFFSIFSIIFIQRVI